MTSTDLAQGLDLPKRAVALVLAGGRGSRLMSLTARRAKPAVYFGGKFRIVDFALSNCLNSGVRRIGVITQYKSHSLLRHLQRGWAFLKTEMNEFVDLLPAQQRNDDESWYRGTADAVYQNHDILEGYGADYIVVLAGDHIYKMNYALMLADHVAKGRPCTVACIAVPREEAKAFGVMAVDADSMITDFVEKPADPPAMPGHPDQSLASMGIYIFDADYLYRELERDMADPNSSHDFGKDIIPHAVRNGCAAAHPFDLSCVPNRGSGESYWRDVGTPTSISRPPNPSSTCTTGAGRTGPTRPNCHRPSSCTTRTTGVAWPSSRWCRGAALSRAGYSARCFFPVCGCIPGRR